MEVRVYTKRRTAIVAAAMGMVRVFARSAGNGGELGGGGGLERLWVAFYTGVQWVFCGFWGALGGVGGGIVVDNGIVNASWWCDVRCWVLDLI